MCELDLFWWGSIATNGQSSRERTFLCRYPETLEKGGPSRSQSLIHCQSHAFMQIAKYRVGRAVVIT